MQFSDKDIERLRMLHHFLSTTFSGASFGPLKIGDMVDSLGRAIEHLESNGSAKE